MNTNKLMLKLSSYRIPLYVPFAVMGLFWILSSRSGADMKHHEEAHKEEKQAKEEKPEKMESRRSESARSVAAAARFQEMGILEPGTDKPFEARALAVNSRNEFFISCKKTVYRMAPGGLVEVVTPPDDVRALAFDSTDRLYLATKDGLYRWENDELKMLFEGELRTMQFVSANLLMISTKRNGLVLVDVLSAPASELSQAR